MTDSAGNVVSFGEALVRQGVTWKLGKVFRGEELIYSFDLLPEEGHKMPAFINLQQYYLEQALVDRAIYGERAFDRLPLLADALLDAGCD